MHEKQNIHAYRIPGCSSHRTLLTAILALLFTAVTLINSASLHAQGAPIPPSPTSATSANGGASLAVVPTLQPVHTLQADSGWVMAALFAPDGLYLATAGSDHTVKIWDTITWEIKRTLTGHTQQINALDISPDGKYLATASDDHTVRVWVTDPWQPLCLLQCKTSATDLAFSRDGHTLATAEFPTQMPWTAQHPVVRIWDVETGSLIRELLGHKKWVTALAFAPAGGALASGSEDGNIRLWNIDTWNCYKSIQIGVSVRSLVFSPNRKLLAAVGDDHKIHFWQIPSWQPTLKLSQRDYFVDPVAFSPDSKMVVTASTDNNLRVWSVANGKLLAVLTGHSGRSTSITFSPDGRWIASSSIDSTVLVWAAPDDMAQK